MQCFINMCGQLNMVYKKECIVINFDKVFSETNKSNKNFDQVKLRSLKHKLDCI